MSAARGSRCRCRSGVVVAETVRREQVLEVRLVRRRGRVHLVNALGADDLLLYGEAIVLTRLGAVVDWPSRGSSTPRSVRTSLVVWRKSNTFAMPRGLPGRQSESSVTGRTTRPRKKSITDPSDGFVAAINDMLITVRWDSGEQTSLIPGPGVLNVIANGQGRKPASTQATATKKTQPSQSPTLSPPSKTRVSGSTVSVKQQTTSAKKPTTKATKATTKPEKAITNGEEADSQG
jgi:hypothetical protein